MDKMRQLTRSLILVLSVVSVTAVIPAAADTQHIPDDTESSERYDQKLWNPELEGERGVPSHLT
jgi:hypothetical protein